LGYLDVHDIAQEEKHSHGPNIFQKLGGGVAGLAHSAFSLVRRKPKESKAIGTIGAPTNFKHHHHIGFDPKTGFEVNNVPDQWKDIFRHAGIKKKDLQDPAMASVIYSALQSELGGDEVEMKARLEALTGGHSRAPSASVSGADRSRSNSTSPPADNPSPIPTFLSDPSSIDVHSTPTTTAPPPKTPPMLSSIVHASIAVPAADADTQALMDQWAVPVPPATTPAKRTPIGPVQPPKLGPVQPQPVSFANPQTSPTSAAITFAHQRQPSSASLLPTQPGGAIAFGGKTSPAPILRQASAAILLTPGASQAGATTPIPLSASPAPTNIPAAPSLEDNIPAPPPFEVESIRFFFLPRYHMNHIVVGKHDIGTSNGRCASSTNSIPNTSSSVGC
jgi:hypothetical protein